jgi:hypothetical protein
MPTEYRRAASQQVPFLRRNQHAKQIPPQKITAAAQVVRKSFFHAFWSEMSLASELSGSEALERVQFSVLAYWDRQWEKRLIATLMGVLYSNVANNGGDMVNDIHALDITVTVPGTTVN